MPGLGGALLGGAALGGLAGGIGSGLAAGQQGVSGTRIRQLTGGITSGGLKSGFIGSPKNRNITITPSAERQGLVNSIADLFGRQAGELGTLRGKLEPGFGALTAARRRNITNAARRSTGSLVDNLSRRRVLGSSFAGDLITRAGREFGQALADADAQSFMEELNANINLLGAQSDAGRQALQTRLNELNVQADLALSILSGSQASVANAFQTSDELRAAFQRDLIGAVTDSATMAGIGLGGTEESLAMLLGGR